MIILKKEAESADAVVRALRGGHVVIIPTDTVYGFSGIVPVADAEIRAIKGRSETKPFIRLISSPEAVFAYTDDSIPASLYALWPGALTLIVTLNASCASFPGETAAFRCPGDEWLRQVIAGCGAPVYSTSVNRSGQPLLRSVAEMDAEFGREVALIVDAQDSLPQDALPSTLVNISGGTYTVLRQGSVAVPLP